MLVTICFSPSAVIVRKIIALVIVLIQNITLIPCLALTWTVSHLISQQVMTLTWGLRVHVAGYIKNYLWVTLCWEKKIGGFFVFLHDRIHWDTGIKIRLMTPRHLIISHSWIKIEFLMCNDQDLMFSILCLNCMHVFTLHAAT